MKSYSVKQHYKVFQDSNPEKNFVNHDLLNIRERDSISECLDNVFKALEVVPGITYKGYSLITDDLNFPTALKQRDIEASRLELVKADFNLVQGLESGDISIYIYIPKLIDRLFYQINGNMFYPILQLVDKSTYSNSKRLTLKTLLLPISLRRDVKGSIPDHLDSVTLNGTIFELDVFKSNANVLLYYFAQKGYNEALRFLKLDEVTIVKDFAEYSEEDINNMYIFKFNKTQALGVLKSFLDIEDRSVLQYRINITLTYINALKLNGKNNVLCDESWRRKLGSVFTNNATRYEEKCRRILVSLNRVLDEQTKINLAHIQPEDKNDIFSLLAWIMREFEMQVNIDNMDILEKRIRIAEYIIHPVLIKFSESTYRLLNSRNLTYGSLMAAFKMFTIQPNNDKHVPQANFLVKNLSSNDLLRYVNMVNSIDLLLALKWTMRGPQGVSNGSSNISIRYRGHHTSYKHRVGLAAASAGDPGVSGSLTPFVKTEGYFFK